MANNVYGSGRKNVGSYQVAGKPYVTASTIPAGTELKVEFPNITNNISVKYKNPRSSALKFDHATKMSASIEAMPVGSAFTIMLRIKSDSSQTADATNNFLLRLLAGGSETLDFILFNPSGNVMSVRANNTDTSAIINAAGLPGDLDADNFSFKTLTVTTDSDTFYRVQLNDSEVRYQTNASKVKETVAFDGIQINSTTPNNFSSGSYDEIALFSTSMTIDEINQLHNSGSLYNIHAHPKASFLKELWTFGDDPRDELNKIHSIIGTSSFTAGSYQDGDTSFINRFYSSTLTGSLRVHFRSTGSLPNVANNRHYWNLESTNEELDMNVKTKEIYLSAVGGDCEFSLEADLTNIPTSSMYQHTGSGVDE